jgi:hypothetical protein
MPLDWFGSGQAPKWGDMTASERATDALQDVVTAAEAASVAMSEHADATHRAAEEHKKAGGVFGNTVIRLDTIADNVQKVTNAVFDQAKSWGELKSKQEQTIIAFTTLGRTSKESEATLMKMKNTLSLTRQELIALATEARKGLGMGMKQDLDRYTKALADIKASYGKTTAMQSAGGLASAQRTLGNKALDTGDSKKFYRNMELVSDDAKEALQTLRNAQKQGSTGYGKTLDSVAAIESVKDTIDERIGEVAGSLTTIAGKGLPALVVLPAMLRIAITSGQTLNQILIAITNLRLGGGGAGGLAGGGGATRRRTRGGGRGGKLKAGAGGTAAVLGGYALDYGADYFAGEAESSTNAADKLAAERTSAGMSIGGSALSGAGYGAMLGSFVPGIGTAVGAAAGGIIGGGMGVWNNWDTFGKTEDSVNRELTGQQLSAMMASTNSYESVLSGVSERAQNDTSSGRSSKLAEARMGRMTRGGTAEGFSANLSQMTQGKIEATSRAREEFDAHEAAILQTRAEIQAKMTSSTGELNDMQAAQVEELDKQLAILQRQKEIENEKLAEMISVRNLNSKFAEMEDATLEPIRARQTALKAHIGLIASINGDYGEILRGQRRNDELGQAEMASIQRKKQSNEEVYKAAFAAAQTDEERNATTREYTAAALKLSQDESELTQRMAEEKAEAYKQALMAPKGSLEYGRAELKQRAYGALGSLAEAQGASGATQGMYAAGQAAAARELADKIADGMGERLKEVRGAAGSAISGHRAAAEEARMAGNFKKASEEMAAARQEELNLIKSETELLEEVATARQHALSSEIAARMKQGDADRGVLDVQRTKQESALEIAQTVGMPYESQFEIQKQILATKAQELQITRQQTAELEQMWQENKISDLAYQKEYQELQKRGAQQQADLVKSSVGLQRDFLDKALAKQFGVPSGSRFQPGFGNSNFANRQIFGEYTQANGMVLQGQIPQAEQRRQLMGAAGLLAGNIPNGQGGAGINGMRQPAGGGAMPGGPGAGPQVVQVEMVPRRQGNMIDFAPIIRDVVTGMVQEGVVAGNQRGRP